MKTLRIILLSFFILFFGLNAQNYITHTEVEKQEENYARLVVLKEKSKDLNEVGNSKHLNEKPKSNKRQLRKELKKNLKKEFKNKIGALRLLLALSIILLIFSLGVAMAFGAFFSGGFSLSILPFWVFAIFLIGVLGVIFSRSKIKKHKKELKEKE